LAGSFCIIEGPETVQDFMQMQLQEIQDNIRSRRNKIFLLMEEVRHEIVVFMLFSSLFRVLERINPSQHTWVNSFFKNNEINKNRKKKEENKKRSRSVVDITYTEEYILMYFVIVFHTFL